MPRRLLNRNLDTREARTKLKVRGKPYYHAVAKGAHLGYRKLKGQNGTWLLRRYVGEQRYAFEPIAAADDHDNSNGVDILDFWQAVDAAKKLAGAPTTKTRSGPYTVAAAVEDYLNFLATEKSPRSAADARYRLDAYVVPTFGKLEVRELTRDALINWRDTLAKTPARLRTRDGEKQKHRKAVDPKKDRAAADEVDRARKVSTNKTVTLFKAALNHALERERVSSDEAWRGLKRFKKVDAARIQYLELEAADRLVNACDSEFRPIVQGALTTGARYGELCRLTVADFNRRAGTVHIRQSKSGKPRHVILTDEGQKLFRALAAGRADTDLIFRKADGSAWQKSHQCRRMREACTNARIKPAISFHILRHTWASLSVMSGMPLKLVAQNLGHRDTQMVELHYAHMAPDYANKVTREHAPVFGFKIDTNVQALR
jgi:integrase